MSSTEGGAGASDPQGGAVSSHFQFKESLHLSASEYGMGSWPKRCGWEPGRRRRGGLQYICIGWDPRSRAGEAGANIFYPTYIHSDLFLARESGNCGSHCLDQL